MEAVADLPVNFPLPSWYPPSYKDGRYVFGYPKYPDGKTYCSHQCYYVCNKPNNRLTNYLFTAIAVTTIVAMCIYC